MQVDCEVELTESEVFFRTREFALFYVLPEKDSRPLHVDSDSFGSYA